MLKESTEGHNSKMRWMYEGGKCSLQVKYANGKTRLFVSLDAW